VLLLLLDIKTAANLTAFQIRTVAATPVLQTLFYAVHAAKVQKIFICLGLSSISTKHYLNAA